MAVLRMAVRESRVCCWFIRHRPYMAPFTLSSGGATATWTWSWGEAAPYVTNISTSSVTMTTMTLPSLQEVQNKLGPDCRASDWIQHRYLARD